MLDMIVCHSHQWSEPLPYVCQKVFCTTILKFANLYMHSFLRNLIIIKIGATF